jgi:hypothetical protein
VQVRKLGLKQVREVRKELDHHVLRKCKKEFADGTKRLARRVKGRREEGAVPISIWTGSHDLCVFFGPAVGMYFRTVELFALAFLVIGVVSMPSIQHYTSDLYSNGTSAELLTGPGVLLYGTGTCNSSVQVPTFANRSVYEDYAAALRANASHPMPTMPGVISYQEHKSCYLGNAQFVSSLCVIGVLLLTYAYFTYYFSTFLQKVDEMTISVKDYSIAVDDPPADAYDPQEWYEYFSAHGEVAAISVIVDNGDLLERLATKRKLQDIIASMPSEDYKPTMPQEKRDFWNSLGIGCDKTYFVEQYQKNQIEIEILIEEVYQVAKVYVTFEKGSQRNNCLANLQQGVLPAILDVPIGLETKDLFRQKHVLALREALEPEELFFQNVGLASSDQRAMQKLVMFLFLAIFMYVEYLLVEEMVRDYPQLAGLVITSMNCIVPEALHVLSALFEVHENLEDKTESVYNKISIFRYFNTVIVIYMITDWNVHLTEATLTKVRKAYLALISPYASRPPLSCTTSYATLSCTTSYATLS